MPFPFRPRATVIIPTYGKARFARWAVNSVRIQTVDNIEIRVICDGSPDEIVAFFEDIRREDKRIRVFAYQKSRRTGEPYRDEVIKKTRGRMICYMAHDDLWLPYHLREMEEALKAKSFVNSLHAIVNTPEKIVNDDTIIRHIYDVDLSDSVARDKMAGGENFFGLTFGAHTRKAYKRLPEGWTTTPDGIATDLFMWQKFIKAYGEDCGTVDKITALSFPAPERKGWTEAERDFELKTYFEKMQDRDFLDLLDTVREKRRV